MLALLCTLAAAAAPVSAAVPPAPGRITGIGGVFVASRDPQALAAWYRDVLGMPLEPWGGAALAYDAPGHPPAAIWSAFGVGSEMFGPSAHAFVLNLAVDDLDAFLARIAKHGVKPIRREDDATGRFASILDPDGTRIELWQPPAE